MLPALSVPAEHFEDALIGVIFPRTTARAYPAMVAIANRAMRHRESEDAGKRYHHVAFDRSAQSARDAVALLEHLRGLSGVQIYTAGRSNRNAFRVSEVLECYANAESCTNAAAWCMEVVRAPYAEDRPPGGLSVPISPYNPPRKRPPLWLFPCRFALHGLRIEPLHPASNTEQIEAHAIRSGCHWCPLFSPAKLCVLKE